MTATHKNAPKRKDQGEPKQKESIQKDKPSDAPFREPKEVQSERGLPVKDSQPSYPAV